MRVYTTSANRTYFVKKQGYGPSAKEAYDLTSLICAVLEIEELKKQVCDILTGVTAVLDDWHEGFAPADLRAVTSFLNWWNEFDDHTKGSESFAICNVNTGKTLIVVSVSFVEVTTRIPFTASISRGRLSSGI